MPSFPARLVGLPVRPDLWRDSPDFPFLAIALPLLVLTLIADGILGFSYAGRARTVMHAAADAYAAQSDPLVWEDGRFSLAGPRIFRMVEEDFTILIDPGNTVPEEEITTDRYLLVREDRVVAREPNQTRIWEAKDFEAMLGTQRTVFDAEQLRKLADDLVYPAIIGAFVFLAPGFDLVGDAIYAVIAGAILLMVRGQWLRLGFAQCFKVALATCAPTVVLEVALVLLGVKVPFEPVLWTVLITGFGLVGLASRQPPDVRAAFG